MLDHVKLFGTYKLFMRTPVFEKSWDKGKMETVGYEHHIKTFMALEDGNGALNTIKILNLDNMNEEVLFYNINDLQPHEPSPEDLRKARQIGKLILL